MQELELVVMPAAVVVPVAVAAVAVHIPAAGIVPVTVVAVDIVVPAITIVMMTPVVVAPITISHRQADRKMVPLRRLPAIAVAVTGYIG
jgi:hypothetical protein